MGFVINATDMVSHKLRLASGGVPVVVNTRSWESANPAVQRWVIYHAVTLQDKSLLFPGTLYDIAARIMEVFYGGPVQSVRGQV